MALLATGCGGGARQVETDLYHRELRRQEDEIYRLEDHVEEYQTLLQRARCEVADLRRRLNESDRPAAGPTLAPAAVEDAPAEVPPRKRPAPRRPPADVDDAMPAIETPDNPPAEAGEAPPFSPSAQLDASGPTFALATADSEPRSPREYPVADDARPIAAAAPAIEVALADGPREGELVATVTGAAVAQVDPAASVLLADRGPEGRVVRLARWDFSFDEVADSREGSPAGPIRLRVSLPDDAPAGRPLTLWVRLTGRDGVRLLTSTDLLLEASDAAPPIASDPQRLPPVAAVADRGPEGEWRPATPGVRSDPLVTPAAFVAPAR